jgi:hypothetical protein
VAIDWHGRVGRPTALMSSIHSPRVCDSLRGRVRRQGNEDASCTEDSFATMVAELSNGKRDVS